MSNINTADIVRDYAPQAAHDCIAEMLQHEALAVNENEDLVFVLPNNCGDTEAYNKLEYAVLYTADYTGDEEQCFKQLEAIAKKYNLGLTDMQNYEFVLHGPGKLFD